MQWSGQQVRSSDAFDTLGSVVTVNVCGERGAAVCNDTVGQSLRRSANTRPDVYNQMYGRSRIALITMHDGHTLLQSTLHVMSFSVPLSTVHPSIRPPVYIAIHTASIHLLISCTVLGLPATALLRYCLSVWLSTCQKQRCIDTDIATLQRDEMYRR